MKGMAVFLIAFSFAPLLERFERDTNSHAATERGVKAFAGKQFKPAIDQFTRASTLKSSAANSFNLGTAQIAAGKREDGAATLEGAMTDPALRADAFYNRGNSALTAKAWDYAIRDYEEALRIRPADFSAKRNLEIALAHKLKEEQEQSSGAGGGKSGAPQDQPKQGEQGKSKKKPEKDSTGGAAGQQPDSGKKESQNPELEAVLRAIQQQESEALQQMKRARNQNHKVGW